MTRLTLQNVMDSALPQRIGLCATDMARIAAAVNEAQERLINLAGDTGFSGGWVRVVFNVDRDDPYLSLPPSIARIINFDVCRTPVRMNNEWVEFMWGSPVRLEDTQTAHCGCTMQTFDRGNFPTAYDIPTGGNSLLRVYTTDARDNGVRIFFAGAKDQNGTAIYEENQNGFYLTYASPFSTTSFIVTEFSGVQKTRTYGDIILKAVDATTGDETLLARFTTDERNPSYRRYLVTGLPENCCEDEATTAQITAMAKLEYLPAVRATDFLIIQSLPALMAECQAIRMENMDSPSAITNAVVYHQRAVQLLNQQLGHEQGKYNPSITVAPFGTATLARQAIGYLV